jgi:hypothetical protein
MFKKRLAKKIYLMSDVLPKQDISNQNVIDVSQGNVSIRGASTFIPDQKIDQETVNLINWLAQDQDISPKIALKKAVVTAAYIRDVTSNQKGQLLVRYPDGSLREIFLK